MDGDENSAYFHGILRGRLKRNSLKGLLINGVWVDDPVKVKLEVHEYFKRHFSEPLQDRPTFCSSKFSFINDVQVSTLDAPFSEEEIKHAVWVCEGFKVPGPDGFTFAFFKTHWDCIKGDIVRFVKEFELTGCLPKGCNSTFITLIPKINDLILLSDYPPISLVGAQYKIIAKLLAERLKIVLPSVVSPSQSAFIKGDKF